MDHLQFPMRDDAIAQRHWHDHVSAHDFSSHSESGLADLLIIGVFSAVAASITVARSKGRTVRIIDDPAEYLPPDGLLEERPEVFFNDKLAAHMRDIRRHTKNATILSRSLFAGFSKQVLGCQEWSQAEDLWGAVCGQVRLLLLVVADLPEARDSRQFGKILEVESLVKRARYGHTPCVRYDGTIIVPGRIDQRREPRIPVDTSVICYFSNKRHPATLKDISINAAGLSLSQGIPLGAAITIELPNARTFDGRVVWSQGTDIGVRFDQALIDYNAIFNELVALRRQSESLAPR